MCSISISIVPCHDRAPVRPLLAGDEALGELAHVHKEQREGEDPSQIVSGEVEPCVVVDLHLGALAAPACPPQRGRDGGEV